MFTTYYWIEPKWTEVLLMVAENAMHHLTTIRQSVIFKVATITFKLRQHFQPTYLSDQLVDYIPNRPLRSASQQLLLTKPTRTVLAQCSFAPAAPNIWNSLPEDLRQCCDLETFRRKLKTYLFSSVYAACAAYPRLRIAFLCYIWRVTNFVWWWWWWCSSLTRVSCKQPWASWRRRPIFFNFIICLITYLIWTFLFEIKPDWLITSFSTHVLSFYFVRYITEHQTVLIFDKICQKLCTIKGT